MEGVSRFIQKGDVVVIKPNVACVRQEPRSGRHDPARYGFGRDAALLPGPALPQGVIVADKLDQQRIRERCFYKTKVGEAAIRAGRRSLMPSELPPS